MQTKKKERTSKQIFINSDHYCEENEDRQQGRNREGLVQEHLQERPKNICVRMEH
jgi:hypothetical protein